MPDICPQGCNLPEYRHVGSGACVHGVPVQDTKPYPVCTCSILKPHRCPEHGASAVKPERCPAHPEARHLNGMCAATRGGHFISDANVCLRCCQSVGTMKETCPGAVSDTTTTPITCPNCGTRHPSYDVSCPKCRERMSEAVRQKATEPTCICDPSDICHGNDCPQSNNYTEPDTTTTPTQEVWKVAHTALQQGRRDERARIEREAIAIAARTNMDGDDPAWVPLPDLLAAIRGGDDAKPCCGDYGRSHYANCPKAAKHG